MKQRIIGALVLISLAVIFVPMMFDEPHDERAVRSLDIPEEPPFPEVAVPEDDDRLQGVPDYRIEEVSPPAPEVVEDPPMGQQPTVGTSEPPAPAEEPVTTEAPTTSEPSVPLVGTGEGAGATPTEAQQAGPSGTQAPAETARPAEPAVTAGNNGAAAENADFERSLQGAWILQLGSFGNEDNARRLRDNVREKGYGAHLQQVTRGDQQLVRVFAGPFTEKKEAESAKAALDKAFGIQALITKGDG